jgi:hypothetical protein
LVKAKTQLGFIQTLIIIFITNLLWNSPFFKAKALKTTNWKLEATISKSWNRAYKMYNMK